MANDFKTFATDGTPTYLQSVADYTNETVRKNGNVPGPASASILNRAWRQAANMTSALGDAIDLATPLSALDDGNLTVLRDTIIALVNTARIPRMETYGAGVDSFVVPAGVYSVRIRAWGAGGGGGGSEGAGAAGGGGGAGYTETIFTVAPGETLALIVPVGGVEGVNNGGSAGANTGGDGGDLTVIYDGVTTVVEITGGLGGVGSFGGSAGAGGAPSSPSAPAGTGFAFDGSYGEAGTLSPSIGGGGGGSPFGGLGGNDIAQIPAGPGGGGRGGSGTAFGGVGADGFVIIEY